MITPAESQPRTVTESSRAQSRLVLSLFPGAGLLDRGFEQAGFCVVRGPDTVFGLLSTRKGRIYYEHEMPERAHVSLLTLLQALPCRVLLSGYPSELYSSQLQRWRCLSYRTRTRGRTVTECLWCNFSEPTQLHDWRFAGSNFRERLSLRRLAARWLSRLEGMPARKRGYVLHAVHQRFA